MKLLTTILFFLTVLLCQSQTYNFGPFTTLTGDYLRPFAGSEKWQGVTASIVSGVEEQENADTINDAVSAWIIANHSSNVIEVNTDEIVTNGKTIDGIHPSAQGYEDMGDLIGDAILNF